MRPNKLTLAAVCGSFLCLVVLSACPSSSTPADTPQNRLEAAKHYLTVAPMSEMLDDAIREMSKQFPDDHRARFIAMMKEGIRVDVLEEAAIQSMAKHLTVAEIDALARFYGSPEGKSVQKKFGVYMAELMPVMQRELVNAAQVAK